MTHYAQSCQRDRKQSHIRMLAHTCYSADNQSLGHLLAALHAFRSNDYSPPECLLRPWESVVVPEGHSLSEPYDLSVISMPPEMYDVNEDSLNGGEGQIGTIKFFADDVSRLILYRVRLTRADRSISRYTPWMDATQYHPRHCSHIRGQPKRVRPTATCHPSISTKRYLQALGDDH